MEEEEIESFRFLRTLWVARGNVAHGKELLWLVNGKKTPFQDVPSAEFFDGASKVTRWLASL